MSKLNFPNAAIVFVPLQRIAFFIKFTAIASTFIVYNFAVNAQSINVIDNPDGGNVEGNNIVFNNQLYTQYLDAAGKEHLAKWENSQLTIIPNPDAGPGVAGYEIVFNNTLCFRYQNQSGKFQLAQYNGDSLTLIDNPDDGSGFDGTYKTFPVIFNNTLYITYVNTNSQSVLAAFDGTTLEIVPGHAGLLEYAGEGIVYHDKLYAVWLTSAAWQLVEFDGTNFNILPNPDGGSGFEYSAIDAQVPVQPIIYNDKIVFRYKNTQGVFQLTQYDGVNISLIPNLNISGQISFAFNPIVYNNKLYTSYDSGIVKKLVEYDGQNLRIIPFPDSSTLLSVTHFSIYNNQLYFIDQSLKNSINPNHLAAFDGTTIFTVPNISIKNFQNTTFETYRNDLFFGYGDVYAQSFLAKYDGNNISLIDNPDSGSGYKDPSVIFNDTLFFVYENVSGINHLAFLNETVLAVSFLHFTAALQNNNVLLQWQTSAEKNADHFKILRSTDGRNFYSVTNILATTNGNTFNNYVYTDANVVALNANKIYYRLQQIDKNGKSTYSNIETININGRSKFFVSPNPAKNFINIVSPDAATDAHIRITDLNGKLLYTGKQNFAAGQQLRIACSQFSKQILIVTIDADNAHQQFKVVCE